MHIVWSLVRRQASRRFTRLQTMYVLEFSEKWWIMSQNQFTWTALQPQCNRKCQFNKDQYCTIKTSHNAMNTLLWLYMYMYLPSKDNASAEHFVKEWQIIRIRMRYIIEWKRPPTNLCIATNAHTSKPKTPLSHEYGYLLLFISCKFAERFLAITLPFFAISSWMYIICTKPVYHSHSKDRWLAFLCTQKRGFSWIR